MDYYQQIQTAESLDRLFEIWKNKKPNAEINHSANYFIVDGIVNSDVWNQKDKKRILYVLKEAYGTDWNENTLATWLANDHPKARIWKRVAKWTYGIQNTDSNALKAYKAELSEAEHNSSLDQIAVINLKKSSGNSSSNYDEIDRYAEYDREEIKKEFELIDADIIICGSTFKTLNHIVFGREEVVPNENWFYYLKVCGRERLFIDYYHPANHWSDLINYYGLTGIYQQALKAKE